VPVIEKARPIAQKAVTANVKSEVRLVMPPLDEASKRLGYTDTSTLCQALERCYEVAPSRYLRRT
jgi:AraC-like DNA-binding protein